MNKPYSYIRKTEIILSYSLRVNSLNRYCLILPKAFTRKFQEQANKFCLRNTCSISVDVYIEAKRF